MCNYGNDHTHFHSENPQIVQMMPVQDNLFAVYQTEQPPEFAVQEGNSNISLVPILFMGLIRHGEKTMVEGFFASGTINSCEDVEGFKGYAASLENAEKLFA